LDNTVVGAKCTSNSMNFIILHHRTALGYTSTFIPYTNIFIWPFSLQPGSAAPASVTFDQFVTNCHCRQIDWQWTDIHRDENVEWWVGFACQ